MNKIPAILLFSLLFLNTSLAIAQTYRWVDKDGVTHFSEQEPEASQVQSKNTKMGKANTDQIAEKEDYLMQRAILEQQISGATGEQRRDQLQRQLLVLDYNWYQKYDPVKAEELAKQLNSPKIRVIPKKNDSNNMKKFNAFY